MAATAKQQAFLDHLKAGIHRNPAALCSHKMRMEHDRLAKFYGAPVLDDSPMPSPTPKESSQA